MTAVSVTHDQEEAMSISDRVAVMNDGDLEQVGEPEVFQHPENRFVVELPRPTMFPSSRDQRPHRDGAGPFVSSY